MSWEGRLAELFAEAEALTGAAREAFLAQLREREPTLADEVADLLAAGEGTRRLIDESPWQAFDGEPLGSVDALPAAVGPYRILRQIGRGGMGLVFLAEQQTESFRRQVALKLIDRPALDPETLRRFRDEVRILAALEHSGIARFLDGGRSPEGVWFLALEYVEGEDLLAHAARRALGIDERVRLFLAVLEAVAFAHSRGVIHRDLKPSNVLVGTDGRPRLLDFGVSKLVDRDGGEDVVATRTELRAFTPAYASPEQFRGERVAAAADVYSLGVVLYELLAGVRPYGEGVESRAELERAVLEREPDPPSTAARRVATASTAPAEHATGGGSRRSRLGRDLDAVCLKALRKEPAERYASAATFADDLACYLEGRPVSARRGGRRYRLGKQLSRHRGKLGLAAALALAAAAFIFGLVARNRAAHIERQLAPPAVRSTVLVPPPNVTVEELERRFAASPESLDAGAGLAWALIRAGRPQEAMVVVGRLRQLPGSPRDPLIDLIEASTATALDEPQRALAIATRGLENARLAGRDDLLPRLHGGRGRSLSDLGRREEARAEYEQALAIAREVGDRESLSRLLNDLAIEDLQSGKVEAGERRFKEALVVAHMASDLIREGAILHNLAGVATVRGRPDEAEQRLRRAVAIFRQAESPRRIANSLGDLAVALEGLGRIDEVEAVREEAIGLLRGIGDDSSLAAVLYQRASSALDRAMLADVEQAAREIETAARASGNRTNLALAEILRGRLAAEGGDLVAARRHLTEARRMLHESGDGDLEAEAGLALADAELAAGHLEDAARSAEGAVTAFRGQGSNQFVLQADALLAKVDARAGRLEASAKRLASLGPDPATLPLVPLRIEALAARAELALARGRWDEARRDLETALGAADAAQQKVAGLRLRLALVELDLRRGKATSAEEAASAIATDAEALGLDGIARRARRLTAGASGQRQE